MKRLAFCLFNFLVFFSFSQEDFSNIESDEEFVFNLDLESLLNTKIVSASKKAEESFDSPLSVSVVTAEQIKNSGATCIEEAFRMIPGVIVREESNGNFDIHLRGLDNTPSESFHFEAENTTTLIMIDGRKVYNQLNGGTFWETLPISLTDVERIEVVRGPSTALYGPNAASGVVNIITKGALKDESFQAFANVQAGGLGTKIANVSVAQKIKDKFTVRGSFNADMRDRGQTTYWNYVEQKYTSAEELIDYTSSNVPPTVVGDRGNQYYPDPTFSKDKIGANLYGIYDIDDQKSISFSTGYQNSSIHSQTMETNTSPFTIRESETMSADLRAKINDLSINTSYISGTQRLDISQEIGYYDFNATDVFVEYDFKLLDEKLTIRPGAQYQSSTYDDRSYVIPNDAGELKRGLLNASQSIATYAASVRFDYQPIDGLRFVAALRGDKYTNISHDKLLSYQFVTSYKPHKNHLFRAVVSKANRGPAIYQVFTTLEVGGFKYRGNPDMDLQTVDMFEFGMRNRINKFIQTDLEVFYSVSDDYSILTMDQEQSLEETTQNYLSGIPQEVFILKNQTLPTVAKQLGVTFSVDIVPSKKIQAKLFVTAQQTKLEQVQQSFLSLIFVSNPDLGGTGNPFVPYTYEDLDHKSTPSYYGGATFVYKPIDKVAFSTNAYFYGEQEYRYVTQGYPDLRVEDAALPYPNYALDNEATIPTGKVESKIRFDAKLAYKVWEDNSVFVSGRNIFNSDKNEFAWLDQIGSLFLAGVDVKF